MLFSEVNGTEGGRKSPSVRESERESESEGEGGRGRGRGVLVMS